MDLSFMVVDDTELDQFIARKMILHADKRFDIKPFYEAISALNYIKEKAGAPEQPPHTLLLLDIFMPIMSGYQFLDAFEELDPAIQAKYFIVALTSSHEPADKNRISAYKSIRGLISKPLLAEDLSAIITKMITERGLQML